MKKTRWILGSQSPRRKELLAGIGIVFETRTKDTPEVYPNELPLSEVPVYLATLKAEALLPDLKAHEAVICADTVVISNGQILGKPIDAIEAKAMLNQLSGQTHEVITGVFIGNNEKRCTFSDRTLVTFESITAEEMEFYIERYKPFDKAGSYGVQEWIGYVAVRELQGTYTNVMGLPTNRLYQELKKFENESEHSA